MAQHSFSLAVRGPGGRAVRLPNVSPNTTIHELRQIYQDREAINGNFRFMVRGKPLSKEHLTLKDYGVTERDVLFAVFVVQGGGGQQGFSLAVMGSGGRQCMLRNVSPNTTIREIQRLYRDQEGGNCDIQFVARGRVLRYVHLTLKDYGVTQLDVLSVIYKVRGGGAHK
eukprot:352415_1